MGMCETKYPGLTQDVLEDYASLTYLNKGEILYLMKKFYSINPEKVKKDYNHRFKKEDIINKFHVLKNNPFQDRLFRVFSSQKDDCFSFEDLLDLCSAVSSECPPEVKAAWAFQVFGDAHDFVGVDCVSFIPEGTIESSLCPYLGCKQIKKKHQEGYDYIDEDNQISTSDICVILDRLTWDPNNRTNFLDRESKLKIADVILKEINLDKSGSISMSEFQLIISRIPEFASSFYFRL